MLAKLSGAPVIPVGVQGAFDAFPRGVWLPRPRKIRMRVGKALSFAQALPEAADQRDALRALSLQMRAAIGELMNPEEQPQLSATERAR